MKRKLFTLFLALLASVETIFAWDYEHVQIGDLYYNLDATNQTAAVTSQKYASADNYSGLSTADIPASVEYNSVIYSVTSIGHYAFSGCSGLTSPVYNAHIFAYMPTSYSGAYTIPNGIESIANNSFLYCSGLTSVTIPNSVTSIGNSAFSFCTGLTSVTIGNSVTSIGTSAFFACGLTGELVIPNSVISIGDYAFSGSCNDLTSITIPNSVTSIGEEAFSNIPNIVYSGTATGAPWGAKSVNGYVDGYLVYSDSTKTGLLACLYAAMGEIVISNSVTSIGDRAFYNCTGLTSITIPNSVTSIGEKAFSYCSNLTSVDVLCETPPVLGSSALNNCTSLSAIYVPCGTLDAYKQSWSSYADIIKYHPLEYIIIGNVNIAAAGIITLPPTICDDTIVIATPNYGYHFVQWSDGLTDNPRTIELTQDTTIEAIFDYLREGKCGKDSVLTWTFNPSAMALEITGKGALSENYTYGTFIEELTIGNEVTLIGQSAFYKCNNLKSVILGSSVKVLEESAFYNCSAIETITCYSQRPPTVNSNALYGLDYSTIVYVPADYLNTYIMHDSWGLYDVRPLGAKTTETTEVTVNPSESTAEVTWPTVSGAATYELVIKDKDGNIICTLIFNSNGQLTQIAFNALARDNAPQQTQGTGFSFTITGLESGTGYDLTITAKDSNGSTLDTQTASFTTTGVQGVEITNDQLPAINKVIENGHIFILRGDKTYTITGQEVR